MNSLRIAIGGARGVIGESLTPDLIVNYSQAFGTYVEGGRVLISRDTRPSGQMVHHCVLAGLLAAGCEVLDLGVCPTPALQLAVRTSDAAGGMAITAGHNPTEWNALKPVRADGIFLNYAQAGELLDIYHQRDFRKAMWDALKPYSHDVVAGLQHLDAIAAELDTDLIRSRDLLVAVDCANGACSDYAPGLLERIGCRVVAMNTETDQPFPHQPEPAAENLSQLRALVQAAGADAGFAFDADGDRLGVVCEDGTAPGEETTVCLATEMILSRGDPGPIVVNLCTTQAVEDIAVAHGGRDVIRTGIGQAYVSEQALNSKACVAGEGSGGCLFPRINYANDSLATMGHILQLVAGRGSLRETVESLPRYAMTKTALPCRTQNAFSALERLREEGEPAWADPAQTELTDGIKYRNRDRWVYVRVSATEPLIRVIAEAPTKGESDWLVREFVAAIRRMI